MKEIHPALKKDTKYIQLKAVPPELHLVIRQRALQSGKTIEQFILDVVAKAVK